MTELADLSATELVGLYRTRSISPVEVVEAVLARIEAFDATLCAMWALDPDGARDAARRSEARWRRGEPQGPIDGVPVTIKENIATKGTAVPLGTAAFDLRPADDDGPPAARVRESGGVILGKTTMPDLGMLSSGLSSFHKLARNPWDLKLNPGGSSSGAGAAGAAGYGPLHIGTDIGGSIRLPASWCGLVGLKPSFGRVPITPPFIGRVAGPMTRSVADAALFMSVLARPDARDGTALPPADLPWQGLGTEIRGLRLGLWLEAGVGEPVSEEVARAIKAAARLFEASGASVEPVRPIMDRTMLDGLDRFWRARAMTDLSKLAPASRAKVLSYILEWIEPARNYLGADVYTGFAQIGALRDALLAASRNFDFIVSPTAPMVAYPAELPSPINDPARPFEHIGFTVAANMSEQPALSINCGYTASGLPIGLQIIGQRFDDIGVLRLARAFERLRPAQRPWPRVGKAAA